MLFNWLCKISEFLNKLMENKSGTLFPFEGIYVKNGKMIRVSIIWG